MKLATVVLSALPFAVPQPSPSPLGSEGFRCATGRLVSVGDRLAEVRERCGEPDSFTRRVETRRVAAATPPAPASTTADAAPRIEPGVMEESLTIDEWTYDTGEGRFVRHLTFENGRLTQVTTGSRAERKER